MASAAEIVTPNLAMAATNWATDTFPEHLPANIRVRLRRVTV